MHVINAGILTVNVTGMGKKSMGRRLLILLESFRIPFTMDLQPCKYQQVLCSTTDTITYCARKHHAQDMRQTPSQRSLIILPITCMHSEFHQTTVPISCNVWLFDFEKNGISIKRIIHHPVSNLRNVNRKNGRGYVCVKEG